MPEPCVHPDVGAYALGLLEPGERAAYERHLRGCAYCAGTLAGLAPLVELLETVDAANLVAATGLGHRFPDRPPEPAIAPVPRPAHGSRPPRPYTRRLALAAAAAAVVVLVGLVTHVARSSVHTPVVPLAEPAPATTAAPSATTAPPRPAPATTRPATSRPPTQNHPRTQAPPTTRTPEKPDRTKEADNIKVGPADGNGNGTRYDGRDPATGATARVEVTPTAAGADVTLTLTHLSGPREGALLAHTAQGTTETAVRWRLPAGTDEVTVLGGTTGKTFERFEVVDQDGRVLVTIPVSSK